MRTVEIKVYKFNELSEEAKKVAIKKEQQYRYEHGEPLCYFEEYCAERLRELGFELNKLYYSLSYSQGDGLSFCGKYLDLQQLFMQVLGMGKVKTAEILVEYCTQVVKGNTGRYAYASKGDVDLYLNSSPANAVNTNNIDAVVNKALSIIEDKYMEACKELEETGYEWIESYNSEQAILETIEANEYEFTEDGQIY